MADAAEDLNYFSSLESESPRTQLFGYVADYTRKKEGELDSSRLAGVSIELNGLQGTRRTSSDCKGEYSFNGLSAGTYQLSGALTNYVGLSKNPMIVQIPGHGCMERQLGLQVNGQITGRVFDAIGSPIPKQTIQLVYSEGNGLAELSVETDEAGEYHFTGVPPGDFLLGVNLSSAPDAKNPYVRTYFPGTGNRDSATIVRLPKAGALTDYDFRLLVLAEKKTAQGTVRWPDGKPVGGASVYLVHPEYPWLPVSAPVTDAQGRFFVEFFSHLRTKLNVQAKNGDGVWFDSGETELPWTARHRYST